MHPTIRNGALTENQRVIYPPNPVTKIVPSALIVLLRLCIVSLIGGVSLLLSREISICEDPNDPIWINTKQVKISGLESESLIVPRMNRGKPLIAKLNTR
jgi:hypothetical protein